MFLNAENIIETRSSEMSLGRAFQHFSISAFRRRLKGTFIVLLQGKTHTKMKLHIAKNQSRYIYKMVT